MAVTLDTNDAIRPLPLGRGVGLVSPDELLRGDGTAAQIGAGTTKASELLNVAGFHRFMLRGITNVNGQLRVSVRHVSGDDGTIEPATLAVSVGAFTGTGSNTPFVIAWGTAGGGVGWLELPDIFAFMVLAFENSSASGAALRLPRLYVAT